MRTLRATGSQARSAVRIVLLALLIVLDSCGQDATPVLITMIGDWPDAEAVELTPVLAGRVGESRRVRRGERQVVLWVPGGSGGTLRLEIAAAHSAPDGCRVGHTMAEAEVAPDPTRPILIEVDLNRIPPDECPLTVELKGISAVTSEPAGIDCQGRSLCVGWFSRGQAVRLVAGLRKSRRFAEWSGACQAQGGSCELRVTTAISAAVHDTRGTCTEADWCLQNPEGPGGLLGIWGVSDQDVVAVGEHGIVQRWNGRKWSQQNSATTLTLAGVWGADGDNIWAVGEGGTIVKWDGQTWSKQPSGTTENLWDVWGTDAKNIWAVGAMRTIIHWDGTKWSAQETGILCDRSLDQPCPLFNAVWGLDRTHVFAVGQGNILFWNGKDWTRETNPGMEELESVWGVAEDHVFAVGWYGTIVKRQGPGTWVVVKPSSRGKPNPESDLMSIWGTDADHIWAAGSNSLLKLDPKTQGFVKQELSSSRLGLSHIWGTDSSHVWIVGGSGLVLRGDGNTWSIQRGARAPEPYLRSVWGTDATHIWAVGSQGAILRWDGSAWFPQASPTTEQLNGVWGTDERNVWAVGNSGTILRLNGTIWKKEEVDPSLATIALNGIWGADANNIWVVGDGNVILKREGETWAQSTALKAGIRLFAVGGLRRDLVWVVGISGIIRKLGANGIDWIDEKSPTTHWLYAVWAADEKNVWVSGSWGDILKWDGSTWSQHLEKDSGCKQNSFTSLWGTSSSDVWAVGYNEGIIIRWDGRSWTRADGFFGSLSGVWGTDTSSVWAVGSSGRILYHQP